ncbi:MAG: hypothetical protein M3Z02_09620 [Actinomycetota bacterium]|nr:hypothetical protein [Actinomycetota bacterium]
MPHAAHSRRPTWRRGLAAVVAAAAVVGGVALAPGADASTPTRSASPTKPAAGPKPVDCTGLADIVTKASKHHVCSHGGDPAPAGADVAAPRALPVHHSAGTAGAGASFAAAGGGITCSGDGVSGQRVQAMYARNADTPDRYSSVAAAISGSYAGQVESVFAASAAETGGVRHVRWVTGPGCALSVLNVVLPAGTPTTFDATINALDAMGYNAANRKYLIWMDATALCGIATVFPDDQPGQANASVGTGWARIDSGCWGLNNHTVEAHELMHTLGSVENTSPHNTPNGHCFDGSELMCYADGSGPAQQTICPTSHANLFDCNHDDYFSATPPAPGNYLATHWNAASSPWLSATPVGTPARSNSGPLARRPGGGFDTFVRGSDPGGTAYHEGLNAAGQVVVAWESLGGQVLGAPAASWTADGSTLDTFAIGSNRRIYRTTYTTASGWSGWREVAGGGTAGSGTIGVTRRPDGTLDLQVRGTDAAGSPYHERIDQTGAILTGWEYLGGQVMGAPMAAWSADGTTMDLAAVGSNRRLYRNTYSTTTGWSGWSEVVGGGSAGTNTMNISRRPDGGLELFVRGTDAAGSPYHESLAQNGQVLTSWEYIGGQVLAAPAASWSADGSVLDVLAVGANRRIYRNTYSASGWTGWTELAGGGSGAPDA